MSFLWVPRSIPPDLKVTITTETGRYESFERCHTDGAAAAFVPKVLIVMRYRKEGDRRDIARDNNAIKWKK